MDKNGGIMTSKEFERYHQRRLFNPFAIHLPDGSSYEVPTPEFAAHAPGTRHVFVIDISGNGHAVIDLREVNRLTFANPELEQADE